MKRALTWAACAVLTTACASENEMVHTATLQSPTRGVALSDDGAASYAGMADTTCTIDTNWGCAVADADLPTTDDRVLDHWRDLTIGGTTQGVHTIGPDGEVDGDIALSSVRTARLTETGLAVVHGDTAACFVRGDTGDSTAIPGAVCGDTADLTVDRAAGALYAATPEGLFAVRVTGAERIADAALFASYDPASGSVFAVDTDARTLRSVGLDGQTAWTRRSDAPITSIGARGRLGEVLVLVDGEDGFGVVERRDGNSGRLLGRTQVPDADAKLLVSEHGARVAMVREDAVHFYALDVGVEPEDLETEQPECISIDRRE